MRIWEQFRKKLRESYPKFNKSDPTSLSSDALPDPDYVGRLRNLIVSDQIT